MNEILDIIISKIPSHLFSGLTTKARITVTTAACLENMVAEGGSTQAIADMLYRLKAVIDIPIRDLNTGKITSYRKFDEMEIGERIFWISLQKVLTTPKEELKEAYLLVVKEPGKARAVTKSWAFLKMILNVVNAICSYPLKKGVDSSQSGMSRDAHGWNFFKDLFTKDPKVLEKIGGFERSTLTPETFSIKTLRTNCFVSSTDYETATDFMHFEVAEIVSRAWMTMCGIPPLLQGIVVETCYQPRTIRFTAKGLLSDLGDPIPGEPDIRSIKTCRGVLMGDPLTKPCLHIVNIMTRVISSNLMGNEADSLSQVYKNILVRVFMSLKKFKDNETVH